MKFTILSHACMLVECNGCSLLTDPWLIGSCYWRSWWNYPEVPRAQLEDLAPDFVYITHLHWDHFHGVSLRKLKRNNKDLKVVIPKLYTTKMVDDLAYCGMSDPIELSHGTSIRLKKNFVLYSYQFDVATDSCIIISDGETNLFDVNDCKIFGAPLRQILRRFSNIDFVFRSHTSATSIPYCVDDYQKAYPDVRPKDDYIKDFCNFSLHVRAKYAIPFASNHCFLHRETVKFNDTIVSPKDVELFFKQKKVAQQFGTKCVVMPPGSSWSTEHGFDCVEFDYSSKDSAVASMLVKHRETLDAQYEKEAKTAFDIHAFKSYFADFLKHVPRVMTRNGPIIVFRVVDPNGAHLWLVDYKKRVVCSVHPEQCSDKIVIEMSAYVLNACARRRMFNVLLPSKRLRITLPVNDKKDLKDAKKALSLLSLYDQDYFPLRKHFTLRGLFVRLRRWRDVYQYLNLIVKYKLRKKPIVTSELWPVGSGRELGTETGNVYEGRRY